MLWSDWNVCVIETLCLPLDKRRIFSKTYPSFLTLKEGSTSHLGILPSGKKRKTALQCYICPTCPSPAGGALTHFQALALSKRARDVTAPSRCSEPLRSKVGGASKPSPDIVRDGTAWGKLASIFNLLIFL